MIEDSTLYSHQSLHNPPIKSRDAVSLGIKSHAHQQQKSMAKTDQHDFNFHLTKKNKRVILKRDESSPNEINLKSIRTIRDLAKGDSRKHLLKAASKGEDGNSLTPIDHDTAIKKLNNILKSSDPAKKHE
mmetsp:Transcript_42298/g.64867  ORF Transcript_42298/g.64867 Transcript_42298/m.64867 type:complete len:130 (-) Transcript_42298:1314-1703(-)|eukprot:CAMPEP_0170498172 /NCGR_PEP_ID=MMETSP0208-20121228/27038_1 /TAXON_ID=197538 /ORGANISM="Strombidium inclinatum, Strain S3" /LENGTH=129 /DNA_ID=CAMNT_0010775267 /DNA_START=480 /DNA_END=869 /DNA_ORIENTATION=+